MIWQLTLAKQRAGTANREQPRQGKYKAFLPANNKLVQIAKFPSVESCGFLLASFSRT